MHSSRNLARRSCGGLVRRPCGGLARRLCGGPVSAVTIPISDQLACPPYVWRVRHSFQRRRKPFAKAEGRRPAKAKAFAQHDPPLPPTREKTISRETFLATQAPGRYTANAVLVRLPGNADNAAVRRQAAAPPGPAGPVAARRHPPKPILAPRPTPSREKNISREIYLARTPRTTTVARSIANPSSVFNPLKSSVLPVSSRNPVCRYSSRPAAVRLYPHLPSFVLFAVKPLFRSQSAIRPP